MVDHLSKEGRSRNMAAIRGKDTKPELALRAGLRAGGLLGYRVHRKDLPGKPDIAYGRWKVAVFVDGVFWHGHPDHWNPEGKSEYWRTKMARNQERDALATAALEEAGWVVIRFWDRDITADLGGCVQHVAAALSKRGRTATSQ